MKKRPVDRNMFYGAKSSIFAKASKLRADMTEAEKRLWNELKNKSLYKVKFRRQHPIDIFIVDFYCHQCRLVIEVDGGIHEDSDAMEYDEGRTHDLQKYGIRVLRFTNDEVNINLHTVRQKILAALEES